MSQSKTWSRPFVIGLSLCAATFMGCSTDESETGSQADRPADAYAMYDSGSTMQTTGTSGSGTTSGSNGSGSGVNFGGMTVSPGINMDFDDGTVTTGPLICDLNFAAQLQDQSLGGSATLSIAPFQLSVNAQPTGIDYWKSIRVPSGKLKARIHAWATGISGSATMDVTQAEAELSGSLSEGVLKAEVRLKAHATDGVVDVTGASRSEWWDILGRRTTRCIGGATSCNHSSTPTPHRGRFRFNNANFTDTTPIEIRCENNVLAARLGNSQTNMSSDLRLTWWDIVNLYSFTSGDLEDGLLRKNQNKVNDAVNRNIKQKVEEKVYEYKKQLADDLINKPFMEVARKACACGMFELLVPGPNEFDASPGSETMGQDAAGSGTIPSCGGTGNTVGGQCLAGDGTVNICNQVSSSGVCLSSSAL